MSRSYERTGRSAQIDMSRKFIGEAISFDPDDLFDNKLTYQSRRPSRMASAVAWHIQSEIGDKYENPDPDIPLQVILRNGLDNTQTFLHDSLHRHRVSPETAKRIIEDRLTVSTLASKALQDESFGLAQFDSHNGKDYKINRDETSIVPGHGFQPSRLGGCPFAGKNGEVHVDPLFYNFAKWAGALSIRSYYNHFG